MAKYTLHNDFNVFDFVLIGISSSENQYVIVNQINHSLKINLSLEQNLKTTSKDNSLFEFSIFNYIDEELGLDYYLVPNRSNYKPQNIIVENYDLFAESKQIIEQSSLLISELPHTNYFIILKGISAIHEQYNVFKLLKEIEVIDQVHEVIPEKLPSKNNLIF